MSVFVKLVRSAPHLCKDLTVRLLNRAPIPFGQHLDLTIPLLDIEHELVIVERVAVRGLVHCVGVIAGIDPNEHIPIPQILRNRHLRRSLSLQLHGAHHHLRRDIVCGIGSVAVVAVAAPCSLSIGKSKGIDRKQ